MLVFWVALLAITNTIGVLFHLYQLIMQTYYTKKGRKEQAERDKRDNEIANNMFNLQTQLTIFAQTVSGLKDKMQDMELKLKEEIK